MKKPMSLILSCLLLLTLTLPALAVDTTRSYRFVLSVDGRAERTVSTGDIITLNFSLDRTDRDEAYDMYAMQNEITYDSTFLELVSGSTFTRSGVQTTDIAIGGRYRAFYMNYVSQSGGESWEADTTVGSVQFRVVGTTGVSTISNRNYLVSVEDGTDSYAATAQNVRLAMAGSWLDPNGSGTGSTSTTDLPSTDVPLSDVPPTAWYYDAVMFARANGLFEGTSATTFSPNDEMTRAMLAMVLYRMEGSPAPAAGPAPDGSPWYTDALAWAGENDIVRGYGNGETGAMDRITREQMAVMLKRYADYKGYDTSGTVSLSAYTDAGDVSNWALEGMQWANAEGLIRGRTATTLVPKGGATRAEVATIFMRYIENIVR